MEWNNDDESQGENLYIRNQLVSNKIELKYSKLTNKLFTLWEQASSSSLYLFIALQDPMLRTIPSIPAEYVKEKWKKTNLTALQAYLSKFSAEVFFLKILSEKLFFSFNYMLLPFILLDEQFYQLALRRIIELKRTGWNRFLFFKIIWNEINDNHNNTSLVLR